MTDLMKILELTYDPKTQHGMVLRLQKQLGQTFKLRFRPIGANGKRKEKKEEEEEEEETIFPILSLPVEIIAPIILLLVEVDPTPSDITTLFTLVNISFITREIIEDPWFERMISKKVLGAVHSRSREERRLGLEPEVAKRYGSLLKRIGRKAKPLQEIADRNAEKYKRGGSAAYLPFIATVRPELKAEEEESSKKRIKVAGRISSWPWWYLRLVSNRHSLESITNPFGMKSDGFSGSVVDIKFEEFNRRGHRLYDTTHGDLNRNSLMMIGMQPKRAFRRWDTGSAGADLMVIPMNLLVRRALKFYLESSTRWIFKNSANLVISVVESMPTKKGSGQADEMDSFYRKEVVITGLETEATSLNLPELGMLQELLKIPTDKIKEFNLGLTLQIRYAYLGPSVIQFLNHKLGARSYLRLKILSLEHVYLETEASSLDLTGIAGKSLVNLRFGPSNLSWVPKLACPSPKFKHITLGVREPAATNILLWDLPNNPAACFPKLESIKVSGNIEIWASPTVQKISKLPKLWLIELDNFSANLDALRQLGKTLERSQIPRRSYTVTVNFITHFDPSKTEDYHALRNEQDNFRRVEFSYDFYGKKKKQAALRKIHLFDSRYGRGWG